jgi:hypothetical protein
VQSPAFHFPQGVVVYLSTGGTMRTASSSSDSAIFVGSGGEIEIRPSGFFRPRPGATYDSTTLQSLWPLEVGKSVQFDETINGESWRHLFRVLRTETVTIAAGWFQTFVVEHQVFSEPDRRLLADYTYWYAPDPGTIVKFVPATGVHHASNVRAWTATRVEIPNAIAGGTRGMQQ